MSELQLCLALFGSFFLSFFGHYLLRFGSFVAKPSHNRQLKRKRKPSFERLQVVVTPMYELRFTLYGEPGFCTFLRVQKRILVLKLT
jgi:hypothetical protein